MHEPVTDATVERWSSRVLRYGVWGSASLMIIGLILAALDSFTHPAPEQNPSLGELVHRVWNLTADPIILMYLGLVLLMFTPIIRVITAIAGFTAERDRRFAWIGAVVLLMLIGEIVYSVVVK